MKYKFNDELVKRIEKTIEKIGVYYLDFEEYAGSHKDIELALKKASLNYTAIGGGNYKVTK